MLIVVMKRSVSFLFIFIVFLSGLHGDEFRMWKDIMGREFEAKLVSADHEDAVLENREGKQIEFPLSDLNPHEREYIREWLEQQGGADGAGEKASSGGYDTEVGKELKGDLKKMERGSLRRFKAEESGRKPEYFAFYHSAHWCPPCRKFTPKLVEWYKKTAATYNNFELVFVSHDRSEDAMEGYMEEMGMPWPALEFEVRPDFAESTGNGIPALVVVDSSGKRILDSFDDKGNYLGPTYVMNELEKLLKK